MDITPPLGTLINGDFINHYARAVHDNLYAKALVMEDGENMLAIVVADICAMGKDLLDDVKKRIEKQIGIKPENILISSTHTHAAGSVESLLLGAVDHAYRVKIPDFIIQAVRRAKENIRPAKIGFGVADAPEHVVCRRFFMKEGYVAHNPVTGGFDKVKTNPFGDENQIDRRVAPMDTQVGFLAVRGMDEKWICLLANYSMHYVGDWENGTITADYFGVFSRQLQNKIQATDGFVGMMSNGTSGEANIWDFLQLDRYPTQFFEKSKLIGNDLAEKVFQSLNYIEWQTNPILSSLYRELPVSVRKPSLQELEKAEEIITTSDYESITVINAGELRKVYAREQILLNEYPDSILFPIQVLRIGDGVIGGLGGEFFAETGLWLKQHMPGKSYFTISLANGYVGYVPPEHEIELGGYETWRCRTSYLKPEAEKIIRNELLKLMNEIDKGR